MQSNKPKALTQTVLIALLSGIAGYFAGRQHLKYELRQGLKGAFSSIAGGLGSDSKEEPHALIVEVGESVRVGGLEVNPLRIEQRAVKGTRTTFSGDAEEVVSEDEVLVLWCRIENRSEGQVISPLINYDHDWCVVRDNFNNRMEPFGASDMSRERWDGQRTYEELKPGESFEAAVLAEKPVVANSTSFVWSLRLSASNDYSTETIQVPFEREVILHP